MWAFGGNRFVVVAPRHEQKLVGYEEARKTAHELADEVETGPSGVSFSRDPVNLSGGNLMTRSSPSRRGRKDSRALVSLLVAAAVILVVVASAQAARRDQTPPTFAGLKSATTCIPGPIGEGTTSSYHLSWEAATDNVTPSRQIVYNIYQATTAGGENFSIPTYRTAPGATSFDTPKLSSAKTFYFVVRARDRAGNEDSNKVEREGQNLCV